MSIIYNTSCFCVTHGLVLSHPRGVWMAGYKTTSDISLVQEASLDYSMLHRNKTAIRYICHTWVTDAEDDCHCMVFSCWWDLGVLTVK